MVQCRLLVAHEYVLKLCYETLNFTQYTVHDRNE